MHPQVDIVRSSTPIGSAATAGSHFAQPLARTLLNPEKPMRFTTLLPALSTLLAALLAAACVGEIGNSRPGRDVDSMDPTAPDDGPCTKIEKDITIRAMADMSVLPKSGCYDIYGKLTLQGSSITTLLALNDINSVDELDLDSTGLTKIDTRRPLGIYGKLTVTSNAKLANLKGLSFETAASGILIDNNPLLVSLDPLTLDLPKLEQVEGDLTITGNPALTSIPLKNLIRVGGATTISGNGGVASIDLSKLSGAGHVDISGNARLTSLSGFTATAIGGVPAQITINGDLSIRNNPVLSSLGTMSSLYRVARNLTIDNNPELINLAAFTASTRFVDQALTITNNGKLADLGQLKRLQLVGQITITGNRNLIACRAIEVDQCTRHPTASVINNNSTLSCNNATCN
jgi:hypothetical protein